MATFLILLMYAIAGFVFKDQISTDTFVLFTGMVMICITIAHNKNKQ